MRYSHAALSTVAYVSSLSSSIKQSDEGLRLKKPVPVIPVTLQFVNQFLKHSTFIAVPAALHSSFHYTYEQTTERI